MENRILGAAARAAGNILGTKIMREVFPQVPVARSRAERRGGAGGPKFSPLGRAHKGAVARDKRAGPRSATRGERKDESGALLRG